MNEQPITSKAEAEKVAQEYFKVSEQPIKTGVAKYVDGHPVPDQPKVKHKPTCASLNHPYADCTCGPDQPNQNAIIIKTIQELTHLISNDLNKMMLIDMAVPANSKRVLISQAIEEIDMFEKTTLFDLQKAFE